MADAVANLGETEVREALLAKATFLVKLGDKARVERLSRRLAVRLTRRCACTQVAAEAAFAETESKVRVQRALAASEAR